MAEYPIEVKVKNSATKESRVYRMRQCTAFEDDSLVVQMIDSKGKTNEKEVWIARIIRDFEGIDDAKVRKMPRWEMETLVAYWKKFNDMDITSFLEVTEAEEEKLKSDTSSQ